MKTKERYWIWFFGMPRWIPGVTGVLISLLITGWNVHATTLEEITFEEQVRDASRIFQAKVLDVKSELRETENGGKAIFSKVTFERVVDYKGTGSQVVVLEFPGGKVGDLEMHVEGVPRYAVGDEVILFSAGDFDELCPLAGWAAGSVQIEDAGSGEASVQVAEEAQEIHKSLPGGEPGVDEMLLEKFEQVLEEEVQRQAAQP